MAIGAVLVQKVDGLMHPIAFASRLLNKHERNYSTTEKEMLAIVYASRVFSSYIFGREIKFFTDHKPLSTLQKAKEPNGRLYRLLLKLEEFNYKIIYYPGALNKLADLLSRPNQTKVEINKLEMECELDWEEEQDRDRELSIVKVAVKTGDVKELLGLDNSKYWNTNKEYLFVQDNILKLKNYQGIDVVVVPSQLRSFICKIYHDEITAGHLSYEKTYKSICSRYYWPQMKTEIFDYCKSCDVCQRLKPRNETNRSRLISIKVEKPWDLVGIDIAGPLKLTKRGNTHFFLLIDYVSKFCITGDTNSTTAASTREFVKKKLIEVFGTPYAILSDQGRNFESRDFDEFCKSLGIKKVRTTAYHPQCNGLAERTIKTIKQMLSAYVSSTHDDWDQVLGKVTFQIQ